MLDVTENGLSILRSERVELGERHLVSNKVLSEKVMYLPNYYYYCFFLLSDHSTILLFSFMNQIFPKAK